MPIRVGAFAYGFPAVALVLGFLLVFAGFQTNNQPEIQAGYGFVAVGVILQLLYVLTRAARR